MDFLEFLILIFLSDWFATKEEESDKVGRVNKKSREQKNNSVH